MRSAFPGSLARAALAAVLLLALAGCKVGLYSKLNEQEVNEIVAVLTSDGIDASKERVENDDWQVMVEKSDLPAALDLLRAHGLPNDRYVSMGDVFQKQGLVSTPSEERMRYIHAMSQELSQTLRKVDGVVAARVHVVIPANDPLSDRIRPSSAAVFIKHRPDVDLRLLAPAVKEMVAHSIEGLSHDQVSLSLFEARKPPTVARSAARGESIGALVPFSTAVTLGVLLLAAALCLAVLPGLLKRRNVDWRTFLRQQVMRR
jgi:type III secretion protein J